MSDPLPPAPKPDQETPGPADGELLATVEGALYERYKSELADEETIELAGRTGPTAAWLRARVGPPGRPHEMELFARELPGEGLEGPLGVLIDYLDGVLAEWLANEREGWLPLDWEGRPFELDEQSECVVFARGEVRDLAAEAAADELLKSS